MKILLLVLSAAIAYGLGGINGAIVASWMTQHKDVRNYGSGNAGLTNYYRTFGAVGVALVIGIDIVKGVVAVLLGGALLGIVGQPTVGKLFAGFCLVLGHMYPAFHRFKGGKGVLCAAVVAFVLDWRIGLSLIGLFALVVLLTRYVSLGSILAALTFPVLVWAFGYTALDGLLVLLTALLIVVKHGENIQRLLRGTESKLKWKKSAQG
ncbi:MAG: glycerol-3-phosphate 1-O-acyltransferase PlsY [Oscillospiraceae bacterium]|nr:glycerol-3-phosphate 1-O-acyltransferase PlsY [Oscillospiraceae bacterium]MBR3861541.1 glycerol-3-phosphate 1-O-acyltransferase PlsY [Oscillospiraceae bacterium]MBR6096560.1 glycerol-3-phosphate 1-O-acyltransferase PlsY [Oscillospiraceae bacterium]MBR7055623.1 glycerol-3-phosphate 1-O-acyltransferase PlsY [Oscillospiraceae bacterium]